MCGIVGYVGKRQAQPILLEGLKRLSYRGYDSAGIAVMDEAGALRIRKTKGRLENLADLLQNQPLSGCTGVGHTRWATHGEPSERNAHPHTDLSGGIAVVHNGIIENHQALRRQLREKGVEFVSQTDTEVIAHLLGRLYNGDMKSALQRAAAMLRGSYALGVVCREEPGRLFCTRVDSPLVIGFQNGEGYIASDIPALLSHTRDVIFLKDHEIGVVSTEGVSVSDADGRSCQQQLFHIHWDLASAEKSGYAHYMLKEIHEQPAALQNTFAPRAQMENPGWLPIGADEARKLKKITFAACGTAYHAAVYGKYVIEKLARVPVEVQIASEYRYRDPIIGKNEWFIAVSQSGETADTLAAMRLAKRSSARVMAICNVVGSSIAREAGEAATLYTYAGPEIAVASTKAYITQAEMMVLLAAALAQLRGAAQPEKLRQLDQQLRLLPKKAEETLKTAGSLERIAANLRQKQHVFFVGRGLDYALSMEAALKLKEVSYVFSESYAAGELKHGPIALLEEGRVVVASITQSDLLEKTLGNLEEAAARGAYILAVCPEAMARQVRSVADETVVIPDADPVLLPLLAAIPMQLFAYSMAVARGCDVDKPRNLAKSVTVE